MGEFKRSPSKVWWANEYRATSESPGQDSGFSDSEHSPPTDLIKTSPNNEKPQNLTTNYKEKVLPEKQQLEPSSSSSSSSSPVTTTKSGRYTKNNSPRVNRNLFSTRLKECVVFNNHHQYAKDVNKNATITTYSGVCCKDNTTTATTTLNESFVDRSQVKSASPANLNKSAPAVLVNNDRDDLESLNNDGNYSLSSDCESELECLFNAGVETPPKHTSTPKSMLGQQYYKRGAALSLHHHQRSQRVPPIISELAENEAVRKWLQEERQFYEQECMTTLQCKSIVAELNQKITQMASYKTHIIRNILSQSNCIQTEFKKLNSEKRHVNALAQSLAGNIVDFLQNFSKITPDITRQYDEIRKSPIDDSLKTVLKLFNYWQSVYLAVLLDEIKKLLVQIENPRSELELRSLITGITSISLHNEDLIETFTKFDIVPILLILCEKCEGSSLRSLLLRCLSTMCCNRFAIRQFEKYSGIQIINDTLEDGARPEPERSETVALLAQITAPWIEDNHSIRGLSDYSKKLIKSLTKFVRTTHCCQNLLLCIAALANLTTMDPKSIKSVLGQDSIGVIFEILNARNLHVSVYILEQIATLIVNMTAFDQSRQYLIKHQAPVVLLHFLSVSARDRDVEKRLQQKTIIALSRLCGEREAAEQIVHLNGIERLVRLCRNKNERFDNDAVLVATLATLRKIADVCGNQVINAEDAQELVEPKLLDSFLAYSTQSESYV